MVLSYSQATLDEEERDNRWEEEEREERRAINLLRTRECQIINNKFIGSSKYNTK